jgi:hypothetical protein
MLNISEETKQYRTKDDIDTASKILEILKGKRFSQIQSIVRLILIIAKDNSKL